MRHMTALAGASAMLMLSGCSIFDIGNREFSCPGMPSGIVCKSTGEVYQLTGENNLQALVGDPVDMSVSTKRQLDYDEDSADARARRQGTENSYNAMFTNPMAGAIDGSIPVLQPAQVLRVWIAPWTDSNENLVWPTYVFTQVKGRTWTFGGASFDKRMPLAPVQLQARERSVGK